MIKKLDFYAQYGVEEYYEYNPDRGDLTGWLGKDKKFTLLMRWLAGLAPKLV
jgi:Uma2 family endonuclease